MMTAIIAKPDALPIFASLLGESDAMIQQPCEKTGMHRVRNRHCLPRAFDRTTPSWSNSAVNYLEVVEGNSSAQAPRHSVSLN